jgi:ribonuclease HI
MKRLTMLLVQLARGISLEESSRACGFSSAAEASRALEGLARSLDGTPAVTAHRAGEETRRAPDGPRGLEHAILQVDGASRGNPGPSAIGMILRLPSGEELYSVGKKIGRATNNVAEYRAVIEGMKLARELGVRALTVRLDSELVMKQLTGAYRTKNAELASLALEVGEQCRHFSRCAFEHVMREENCEADRLANEALNRVIDP